MGIIKKYVNMLASTDQQTLDKIKEYEKQGRFNDHLDTNPAPYIPVDKNFQYIPKNVFKKLDYFFKRLFIVNRVEKGANKLFQTEVIGKENIKGIKNAIVCCNHVNKLDCMVVRHALRPRKTYFTAAEFNNMKGFLGNMMRAGGLLPMSTNFSAQKNFFESVSKLLKNGNYITFFPERAEWWGYEKPRPHEKGAYHIAVRNSVPVIPVFITFRPTKDKAERENGIKQFVVNILKPIFPDGKISDKENIDAMMKNCIEQYNQCYEDFYNKK